MAMTGFVLLHVAGMVGMRKGIYALAGARYVFGDLGLELPYEALKDVATFWILVGLAVGFDYYRRYRDRDVRAAQLESQLTAARLRYLRHQLHPHFLFNTLNTISAVMHEDVRAADTMLSRLSDLLRLATRHAEDQEVRLQEELDALDVYLEIMRVRMGDRLRSAVDVAPDTRDALVPFLVLQPLVENAVKHGIAARPEGGWLGVRAYRRNGMLRLEVEDDGPGVANPPGALSAGFGLGGTAERLQHLYGTAARPVLERSARGGLRVTIDIPWRLAAPEGP
jgi:LytS/YehU family sensor histidine kinase